jgi:hypothetical protein
MKDSVANIRTEKGRLLNSISLQNAVLCADSSVRWDAAQRAGNARRYREGTMCFATSCAEVPKNSQSVQLEATGQSAEGQYSVEIVQVIRC